MMSCSRLGELLSHYGGYSYSSFIIHLLRPGTEIFIMNRQSLPTSPLFQSDPQNEKEGPELNHDYPYKLF